MKAQLRKLFAPILIRFEEGDDEYNYKSSHRTILKIVGTMFLLLSAVSLVAATITVQAVAVLPFLVFFCASSVCLIVGFLGNNRAVAKIWRNR
ncbi:MAG: hypothetical protein WBN40_08280 [Pseudomonadales bacterium]